MRKGMSMFDKEGFCKIVDSGSLHDLFKMIYEVSDINLLDLALMRLVKKQNECKDLESKVYELLRHRADVNVCDLDNKTPLHYAAIKGNSSLIDLLLHYGASVKSIDSNGNTVLHSVTNNADPLSLSLLLVKVYSDAPELFEIRDHQRKKFNELFRTRQQVLLFNRFKELKGIKMEARLPAKGLECGRGLIALMVIDDFKNVKRPRSVKDVDVPLSLSTKMSRQLKKKRYNNEYLKRYGGVDKSLESVLKTSDFSQFGNLVDQISKGNPFNAFNYACTMLSKDAVIEMINTMQPRLKRGDYRHTTFNPVDTLKLFHPDLVDTFLRHLETEEICSICKEADAVRGQTWTTLSCKHQFHTSCIKDWFQISWERSCPMCRRVSYTEIK